MGGGREAAGERDVRDERQPEHADPGRGRGSGLGDGGHPDGARAQRARHGDLRRRLVGRTERPGVHALAERDPALGGGLAGERPERRAGTRSTMRNVAPGARLPPAEERHLVGDEHEVPHGERGIDAAGGVREHERGDAECAQGAHGERHLVRAPSLVVMHPSRRARAPARRRARTRRSRPVAADGGNREAGDLREPRACADVEAGQERREPGSEDDGEAGAAEATPIQPLRGPLQTVCPGHDAFPCARPADSPSPAPTTRSMMSAFSPLSS